MLATPQIVHFLAAAVCNCNDSNLFVIDPAGFYGVTRTPPMTQPGHMHAESDNQTGGDTPR